MNYQLHPQAALEHEEQVIHYENCATGLGARYNTGFRKTAEQICLKPTRFKFLKKPDIRQAAIIGFPYFIVFRVLNGGIQILAVAHYRRRPNDWSERE